MRKLKTLQLLILISSLSLAGCFDFSTNSKSKETPIGLNLLWDYAYDLDGGAPSVKPLLHGSMIITSGDINVTSLKFETGEMIWKTPFEHHMQLMNRSFGFQNNVIAGSVVKKIMTWNVTDGQELFSFSFPDSLSFNDFKGISTTETSLIAVSNGRNLYKLDHEGNLNIIPLNARSYETTVHNNVLFAGQRMGDEGIVSAYNVHTMELLWSFNPGSFGFFSREAPIVENNIVYVGTTDGPTGSRNGFFALNAQTGEEIWRREGIFTYSAVLAGDRIFGVNGQRVWALDKHTGELLWITQGRGGHSESNLDYLDGYVYWAHGGGLHVFNAESGELLHVMPAPDGSFFWRVTAGAGRIFAQSNRHLYAFAPWGHTQPLD